VPSAINTATVIPGSSCSKSPAPPRAPPSPPSPPLPSRSLLLLGLLCAIHSISFTLAFDFTFALALAFARALFPRSHVQNTATLGCRHSVDRLCIWLSGSDILACAACERDLMTACELVDLVDWAACVPCERVGWAACDDFDLVETVSSLPPIGMEDASASSLYALLPSEAVTRRNCSVVGSLASRILVITSKKSRPSIGSPFTLTSKSPTLTRSDACAGPMFPPAPNLKGPTKTWPSVPLNWIPSPPPAAGRLSTTSAKEQAMECGTPSIGLRTTIDPVASGSVEVPKVGMFSNLLTTFTTRSCKKKSCKLPLVTALARFQNWMMRCVVESDGHRVLLPSG
jgi:hypothetical protein